VVAARQSRTARSTASTAQRAGAYQELRHAIVEALMVQEKLRAFAPTYGSLVGVAWNAPPQVAVAVRLSSGETPWGLSRPAVGMGPC